MANPDLQAILREIAIEGATGVVTSQGSLDIVSISFLDGDVVAVDSMSASLEEQLGRHLIERELIEPEDWSGFASEGRPASSLIDRVVESGLFGREQLLMELRSCFLGLLRQAASWEASECRFFRGEEVSFQRGIIPISLDEIESVPAGTIEVEAFTGSSTPESGQEPAPVGRQRRFDFLQVAPLILLGGLLVLMTERPSFLLFPFPWQSEQRSEVMREQNAARLANISQAARSYYLVEGRFPENPDVLADLALVRQLHLVDALGRPLDLVATDSGFEIVARDSTEAVSDVLSVHALSGDFLLDRAFAHSSLLDRAPLVLLD